MLMSCSYLQRPENRFSTKSNYRAHPTRLLVNSQQGQHKGKRLEQSSVQVRYITQMFSVRLVCRLLWDSILQGLVSIVQFVLHMRTLMTGQIGWLSDISQMAYTTCSDLGLVLLLPYR